MKKIYTMETEETTEYEEIELAMKARDIQLAVDDFLGKLRQKIKYSDGDVEQFEEARKMIWESLAEYGLEKYFA